MPMVRALVFHVRSEDLKAREVLRTLRELKHMLEVSGITVWTLRVSLSEDFNWRDAEDLCNEEVLLAAYHKDVRKTSPSDLEEYLRTCNTGYATLLASDEDLDLLTKVYMELSKRVGEEYFTRIGVSYGGYLETPYFPLSTALRDSLSVAYRYVDLLLSQEPANWERSLSEFVKKVDSAIKEKTSEVGLKVYHDVSLSPWMEESAVDVIERLDATFPGLGSFSAVHTLNKLLSKVASTLPTTGFNELMLPVAEDDRLKDLARTGRLRVGDLVALSAFCVAGLDMVAVPRDSNYLRRLFRDTYATYLLKKRPYGVRVIPTDRDIITLRGFGELPRIR
jgi:uncharacterized protein (UPF0210 family)